MRRTAEGCFSQLVMRARAHLRGTAIIARFRDATEIAGLSPPLENSTWPSVSDAHLADSVRASVPRAGVTRALADRWSGRCRQAPPSVEDTDMAVWPRVKRLHVACAIDADVIAEVRRGRANSTRTRYDSSIVEALRRNYQRVDLVAAVAGSAQNLNEIVRIHPDVVFNLAFNTTPVEVAYAGALQFLGMPYTGSGPVGIVLSQDKVRSHHVLAQHGLRVPKWVELKPDTHVSVDLTPPLIVKPTSIGGSVGIYNDSVLRERTDVARLARRIWSRFRVSAICEEFIVGRDLKVGLVETAEGEFRVTGISEWTFGASEPGWGYRTEAVRINPEVRRRHKITRTLAPLAPPLFRRVAALAVAATNALGVRGYAAVDLRIDTGGDPVILEVNANPGLWAGSAAWGHPDFDRTLHAIVRAAFREKQ